MRVVIGVVVGGLVGFALGSSLYLGLTPSLEEATGPLREMQGLLWNLVPLLTLSGAALGWWVARRHRSPR